MGREMGGRFKREGTYVYLWLIHVDVWQKTTKFCKAIILQLKKEIKKKIGLRIQARKILIWNIKGIPPSLKVMVAPLTHHSSLKLTTKVFSLPLKSSFSVTSYLY